MWMSHYGKLIHQRPCECRCLHNNVLVESLIITLTIVSCMAVTGQTLISFDFLTVPRSTSINNTHPNGTPADSSNALLEDEHVLDILELVFCYTSLAVAGIFVIEILLKLISLRKICIRNPWQVFDALVVIANAAVQLTFYFISVSDVVYCASFVVILRLWRVPFVCFMKAHQIREQMEQDVELYRSGQRKAEEKCHRLENDLTQKKEKINKLEHILQHIMQQEKKNEMNTDTLQQSILSPLMRKESFALKNNSLKNGVFKSKLLNEEDPNLERTKTTNFDMERNVLIHHNNLHDKRNSLKAQGNNLIKEKYAAIGIFSGTLPRSETMCPLQSMNRYGSESAPHKQRRRRSSTSDYIDYSTLNSPTRHHSIREEVKELSPSSSCPCLDICEEKANIESESKDKQQSLDMTDGSAMYIKQSSVVSGTTSDASSSISSPASSSVAGDEQRHKSNKRIKRFPSCPEYVYTQRMSVTNDESLLIEEHTQFEPLSYDNSAFLEEEGDIHLQILAEIDGTKTYRSEDGIPMTSL